MSMVDELVSRVLLFRIETVLSVLAVYTVPKVDTYDKL